MNPALIIIKMKCFLSLFIAYVGVLGTISAQPYEYEAQVSEIIDQYRIPGISLSYWDEIGEWRQIAIGKQNMDSSASVNSETIFSAASLSKPITAYLTLLLVDQGKIDLNKPLAYYFEYPDLLAKPAYEQVTAKMVLTHHSGLPNWRYGSKLTFKHPPESKFSYSGEGFVWLQKVIEHIEGKPFQNVANTYVFEPLQMDRTSFVWDDRFEANFAYPHDEVMFSGRKYKPAKVNAAASLQTTAKDYAKFLNELIQPTYLSKKLRDEMLREQVIVDTFKKGEEKVMWGLGVALQETAKGVEFWHWGNNGRFRAFFVVSPTLKRGMVYFANSKNGLAMTNELTDIFIRTPQPGYRWNGFKGQGKWYRFKSIFKKKNTPAIESKK